MKVCDDRLEAWASRVVNHLDMTIDVEGREHFSPRQTYLVMSNHQSHYDVPVLFHVLGPPHGAPIRMVAKIELFSIPFFGPAMREAGFIAIDRNSRKSALESLEEAKRTMQSGVSVWIAPEGTRSPNGQLLPFKKGGFHLALDMRQPVLPVTVVGTRDALPRGQSGSMVGAHVRVKIHRPIDTSVYADDAQGITQLCEDVRAAIASGLP